MDLPGDLQILRGIDIEERHKSGIESAESPFIQVEHVHFLERIDNLQFIFLQLLLHYRKAGNRVYGM